MERRETGGRARAAGLVAALALTGACAAQDRGETPVVSLPPELRQGREMLKAQQFREAAAAFGGYLKAHPGAIQAELGLGDAQVGLHQLEAAEITYRGAAAAQPELWQAHKDLVLVEAKLGRWEEFDRERTVLRMARERRAPGISMGESDLIDSFNVGDGHWVVRAYPEPVGRSRAWYNFERFSPQGRIEAYVSLEDKAAAEMALRPGDVRIGVTPPPAGHTAEAPLALNWYTGRAHGTIRSYGTGLPTYEQLRAAVMGWLRSGGSRKLQATTEEKAGPATTRGASK